MLQVSRRDLILSAAGATAAFGLAGPVAFIGAANAQKAPEAKPFHKMKIGDVEVTTVFDGLWQKPHDPGFIKNASVDDTKAALKAAGQTDEYVPITFTVTIVKIGGRTIMFDSGTGGQTLPPDGKLGRSGFLAENMKAAGIDPASINTILVTHFHPDHIFGLMAPGTNAQVYPNAEILMPAAEYAWWTDAGLLARLPEARHGLVKRIQATFPTWKNIKQFSGDKELVPGIVSMAATGHTPGHTAYVIGSGAGQLIVSADITNIPALFVKNPGWHAVFDGDAQMAEASRRKLFDRAIADKAVVTGYHWGIPGAGTMMKDGNGYAFVPAA